MNIVKLITSALDVLVLEAEDMSEDSFTLENLTTCLVGRDFRCHEMTDVHAVWSRLFGSVVEPVLYCA